LTDQLWNLAESYGTAARNNPATTTENVDELVEDIKKATVIRNVLCHGSWRTPNPNGASVPLFVNRQKQVFDTAIDVAYLEQVQAHVAGLACSVIDTVTHPYSILTARNITGRHSRSACRVATTNLHSPHRMSVASWSFRSFAFMTATPSAAPYCSSGTTLSGNALSVRPSLRISAPAQPPDISRASIMPARAASSSERPV
jgi:hypothetical protein